MEKGNAGLVLGEVYSLCGKHICCFWIAYDQESRKFMHKQGTLAFGGLLYDLGSSLKVDSAFQPTYIQQCRQSFVGFSSRLLID